MTDGAEIREDSIQYELHFEKFRELTSISGILLSTMALGGGCMVSLYDWRSGPCDKKQQNIRDAASYVAEMRKLFKEAEESLKVLKFHDDVIQSSVSMNAKHAGTNMIAIMGATIKKCHKAVMVVAEQDLGIAQAED